MYTQINFKTKKELKAAVASGKTIFVFEPGVDRGIPDGDYTVEGPQFPEPHKWYARVTVVNGVIIKVKQ